MAEKITYTNSRGQSVELTKSAPFILQFLEGAGGAPTDVQLEKSAFQDGGNYLDTYLEPRVLNFEVAIRAENEEDLYSKRAELAQVFNPKLGEGELVYNYGTTGEKRIVCVVDRAPVFLVGSENRSTTYQKTVFTIIAPEPFWTDNFVTGEILSQSVPQFEFDLELTDEFEFEKRGTNRTTINNTGDVETPVEIVFEGPASNPVITNETTGEFISVQKTLLDGESLLIGTAFGNKYVLFDDGSGTTTNAFGNLTLDSVLWNLEVGENEVVYTADAGIDTASMRISWRQRYVGV